MGGHELELVWERKKLECTGRLVKFGVPGRHTSMTRKWIELNLSRCPLNLCVCTTCVCAPHVCVLTEVRAVSPFLK